MSPRPSNLIALLIVLAIAAAGLALGVFGGDAPSAAEWSDLGVRP